MQEWLAWQFLPLIRVWRRVQCVFGQHRYLLNGTYINARPDEENGPGIYYLHLCFDCHHAQMEFWSSVGSEHCWRMDKHGDRMPMKTR